MKRIFTVSLFSTLCAIILGGNAMAAIPWWLQPTICRPNPTGCYASMGSGFDDGMWDATSNCWGLKMICGQAIIPTASDSVAMGKTTITAGTGINNDFDTDLLNGDCFGSRKTTANGSMASVNGTYVNVWCNGILDSADEVLPTGEITFGTQPKCKDIAPNGWVAVLNQKCYGKYYDPSDYYIECEGNNVMPTRLIELNGAAAIIGTGSGSYDYPTDTNAAKSLFDKMQATSTAQKAQYFNND
ncbi:MAG: hypothetical protein LBF37_01325 [Rickettsiales bacterium]|nr:hypothetical protein [Rickettsiales bacterium]